MPATPTENPYDVAGRVAEAGPEAATPDEDLKPMFDELDRLIAGGEPTDIEAAPADAPVEGEMAPEAAPEAPPAEVDVKPLVDELGIDEARAQSLYDAAQQIEQTRGLPPAELAQLLANDMQLRMRLEAMAAGESDRTAAESMDAAGFDVPPAEAAPGNEEEMV